MYRKPLSILIAGLLLASCTIVSAQSPSSQTARDLMKSAVGDWIGTCDQTTDGDETESKYFHAKVRQTDECAFRTEFGYYRADPGTGAPVRAGSATMISTIRPDGTVKNSVTGEGSMYVFDQLKPQKHEYAEEIRPTAEGTMEGSGSGTLRVEGMPLGLGKKGKIRDAKTFWSVKNGVLAIRQTLKATFKALIFSKSFRFEAQYTAKRGSDVASLITKGPKVARKP